MLVSELIMQLAEEIAKNGDALLFDDSGYYQIKNVEFVKVENGIKIDLKNFRKSIDN